VEIARRVRVRDRRMVEDLLLLPHTKLVETVYHTITLRRSPQDKNLPSGVSVDLWGITRLLESFPLRAR
jgi:hypothetical protein